MGIGGAYERELRSVLAGEEKGVRAITRSCSETERAQAMQICQRPFLVVRAPGSGSEGTGDLLALRGDMCFPIEVKSSKKPKLYLSGRTVLQYKALEEIGIRCSIQPFYAYRLKGVRGDSWRIFRVKTEGLTGKLRLLSRTVPELPLTRNGTPYLDWNKGLPLHKFLSLISKSENANNIQTTALEENTNFPMKESIMTQYESSSERTASSLSNS
ncbi:MAG: Holliday junction resolvase [Euryarchaeota archaeon]|jgi:Holliday junction resolvase|nr:Holliday junction resolvase [Euryarchaeota archaeon]|tara:strand:+ start:307 stop:948 length:642 start_codon:yes stop_codon:yes gene_type:complete